MTSDPKVLQGLFWDLIFLDFVLSILCFADDEQSFLLHFILVNTYDLQH